MQVVGSYQCRAMVPLGSNLVRLKNVADMTLVQVKQIGLFFLFFFPAQKCLQNVFYLITPSRTFTFMGSDPDEKEGWMRDLNKCIASSSVASLSQAQKRIEVTILGSEVMNSACLFVWMWLGFASLLVLFVFFLGFFFAGATRKQEEFHCVQTVGGKRASWGFKRDLASLFRV